MLTNSNLCIKSVLKKYLVHIRIFIILIELRLTLCAKAPTALFKKLPPKLSQIPNINSSKVIVEKQKTAKNLFKQI